MKLIFKTLAGLGAIVYFAAVGSSAYAATFYNQQSSYKKPSNTKQPVSVTVKMKPVDNEHIHGQAYIYLDVQPLTPVDRIEITIGENPPIKANFNQGYGYWGWYDFGKMPGGAITIKAEAFNKDGDTIGSAQTHPIVENAGMPAPTVTLISPTADTVKGDSVRIAAKAVPDQGFEKLRIEYPVSSGGPMVFVGAPKTAAVDFKPGDAYEADWDTTKLRNGEYTLTARLLDKNNVVLNTAQKTVTVQNPVQMPSGSSAPAQNNNAQPNENHSAPEIEITSPADGDSVKGTVAIKINATSDAGIDQIEIRLPSGEMAYPMKNKIPYSWNWDSTGVSDGSYAIEATAKDNAGKSATTKVRVNVQNSQE